jgi:hypothetical protein
MAIKKAQTQVQEAPVAVASMNPDNMATGGLKDDFDGEITKVRLVPWDYDGKIDHHILAVAVTIQPDGEEVFTQHYSCGELEHFQPSKDGKTPVDLEGGEGEDLEGVYALRVGRRDQLNNNTNWAHFIGAALDAGFPKENLGAAVTFLEGTYGHFNRIQQKKRSGIVTQQAEGQQARRSDILVITELKDKPAGAKTSAKAAPATAKPAAASGLDDRLREVVTEAVLASDDGIAKSKLAGIVIKAFQGPDKARAIKRVNEVEFLESSETWVYDADSGTLLPA